MARPKTSLLLLTLVLVLAACRDPNLEAGLFPKADVQQVQADAADVQADAADAQPDVAPQEDAPVDASEVGADAEDAGLDAQADSVDAQDAADIGTDAESDAPDMQNDVPQEQKDVLQEGKDVLQDQTDVLQDQTDVPLEQTDVLQEEKDALLGETNAGDDAAAALDAEMAEVDAASDAAEPADAEAGDGGADAQPDAAAPEDAGPDIAADPCLTLNCDDGNICTDDACDAAQGCKNTANSAACSDANVCTVGDACQGGACVPASVDPCDDGNPCTTDSCTVGIGCAHAENTEPCNDGNLCTQADQCAGGQCAGSKEVACSALDGCHDVGACNPVTGSCSNPAKVDGGACSDGNPCTSDDACITGSCVGKAVGCTAPDGCHDAGVCDPAIGGCTAPAKSDGTPCVDGNPCTSDDACITGSCVGKAVGCTALDICHDAGVCDPATGGCSTPAKGDGTPCDDGQPCTMADQCSAGVCQGSAVPCGAQDQCHSAGVCLNSLGGCTNPVKDDGSACSDGNACTQGDACQGGACTSTSATVCAAGEAGSCQSVGACDPASGVCSTPSVPDGTGCDDGDKCTEPDSCTGGVCGGAQVACDDGNVCTADSCVTAKGGCVHVNVGNGSPCPDGLGCTEEGCYDGACEIAITLCIGANTSCQEPAGTCACNPGFQPIGLTQGCECPSPGLGIDIDGDGTTECAIDFPIWGIRPTSPPKGWFVDGGDGTVTDKQSQRMWQQAYSPTGLTQSGATSYCAGLVLGGHSDWRLPTDAELQTLTDYAASPAVAEIFGTVAGKEDYWTLSQTATGPLGSGWAIQPEVGQNKAKLGMAVGRARCVRWLADPVTPKARFTVEKSVVTDHVTGLDWQWGGSGLTWLQAQTVCNMGPGPLYRLPTITELASLVDRTAANPAFDHTMFPWLTPGLLWTQTLALQPDSVWAVQGSDGQAAPVASIGSNDVLCVKGSGACSTLDCDDGNACTTDLCDPVSGCSHASASEWTPCGTGMICSGKGVCQDVKAAKGMAFIPAGTFWMGCVPGDSNCISDEQPRHSVTLDAYYIDVTEVTVAAYKKCVDAAQCAAPSSQQPTQLATYPGLVNNPVNFVDWTQADTYCKWNGGHLPSEAQWERASRAGVDGATYPWGETWPPPSGTANFADDAAKACYPTWTVIGGYDDGACDTAPVGTASVKNGFGLFDMAGNVREWVSDWYDSTYYGSAPTSNPGGPGPTAYRARRGGSFVSSNAIDQRSSRRGYDLPSSALDRQGFRCSRPYP